MLTIEKKKTDIDPRVLSKMEREPLILGWEDRRRGRQRVRTLKGTEIALALPTGTILKDGDVLFMDTRSYIAVEAAREEVIGIRPETIKEAAFWAYEIGNRHLPICIQEGMVLTPRDRALEQWLNREGITYRCLNEIFEPARKAHDHG